MKKKIVVIQAVVIAILIAILTIILVNPYNIGSYFVQKRDPSMQTYLEYGDKFEGIEIVDFNGNKVDSFGQTGKYTIVMYLSSSCSSCIESLSDFRRFSIVFGDDINYIILWYEEIPTTYLTKYSIETEINYSLEQKMKISTSTPTYYILDSDGDIVFRDISRSNLIEKMINLELVSNEILIENANRYIIDNYYPAKSDKKKLVYFYMPGCPDCESADSLMAENSIENKYDMIHIYKYDTVDSSKIVDKDKLFVSVYGITWYPSFLILTDDDFQIIGETTTEDLINELAK